MTRGLVIFLGLGLATAHAVAADQVDAWIVAKLPHSNYQAYTATVSLPAEGMWQARHVDSPAVSECYLYPRARLAPDALGRRFGAAIQQERLDQGGWKLSSMHWTCLQYARTHDGRGPAKFADLDERGDYWASQVNASPWQGTLGLPTEEQPSGPFVFLVPEARFRFSQDATRVRAEDRELLAFELRPYLDDGKHWVLYTDGTRVREEISLARLQQYGAEVRPVTDIKRIETPQAQPELEYTLVLVCRQAVADSLRVTAFNLATNDERQLDCGLASATESADALSDLQRLRRYAWRPYLASGRAPVLASWAAAAEPRDGGRPNRSASTLSLLGGRAAIEETLQLQDLNLAIPDDAQATVDVTTLAGVQVKSHPFQTMLQGQPGGELPLANYFPPDRMFVYVGKPEAILPLLDDGTEFAAILGSGLTGNRLRYGLADRYLRRLGMHRGWLEAVLRSGMIRQLAVSTPDLYLIDGTEITVVAQLAQPQLLQGLLRLLRVGPLSETAVARLPVEAGRSAWWTLRGDLLCLSSSEAELQRTLSLIETEGTGSLGRSDEFRYMLTQLPIQSETRFYAYLSDPFIRRLVGPELKLGQARRVRARAAIEAVTAQAIQAKLDGVDFQNSVARLAEFGYLPATAHLQDLSLAPSGVVSSPVYGSLATYRSLDEVPLGRVTPDEAEAYRQYVEEYSRYWRQFFDPIALRLNDTSDNGLELATFILPLIDSSIYEQIRRVLLHHEDGQPLAVPQLVPQPVLQLSLNLREDAWRDMGWNVMRSFNRWIGISPTILDDLGPSVHLAVFDADPVINFGSGDVLGAFGGSGWRAGRNEMLLIPVMLSVLTRPSTILLETQNPQRTVSLLRQAAGGWSWQEGGGRRDEEVQVSFYQEQGRDAWVWQLDLLGTIKLRFGIEVEGRYVLIRNLPWSVREQIASVESVPHNGAALSVAPAACRVQLPSLYASAADQQRRQALAGASRLYPLLLSGTASMDQAAARHAELFGFAPVHPGGGKWFWEDQQVQSSTFGSVLQQRQPGYEENAARGLLERIERLQLNMQLEDAGLRSSIRWRYETSPQRD